MIQLLVTGSVRAADAALLPRGARAVVIGAMGIATEAAYFRDRVRAAFGLT
ncbi:hypothetical protein ACH4MM_06880 [Streptomyces pratensis]|uniref:hypothetical protein n=1 Tax=Streptomyces pratensis TaxID=1169025 RepID=UPI0037A86B3C